MNILWIQQFLLLFLCLGAAIASAYRTGDAVDTDVVMDGWPWDALRSQMPKFGINTKVHFDMDLTSQGGSDEEEEEGRRYRTFALLFEDGLRSIETRPYEKNNIWRGQGQTLERVLVKFIYSKSGTGMIHSVSSTAVYKSASTASSSSSSNSNSNSRRFRVEYEWQEEEAVRLTVGSVVMFLAVFLSSIVFLFHTCGLTDGDPDASAMLIEDDDYNHTHYDRTNHKKW